MSSKRTRPATSARIGTCAGPTGQRAVAGLDLRAFGDEHDRAGRDRDSFEFAALVVQDVRFRRCGSGRACSPFGVLARRSGRGYSTVPAFLRADFVLLDAPVAVPPIWNVRMVNCVPGSPMDCAAMMPTASPSSTSSPARQVHAVARCADAERRFARQRRADADLLEAQFLDPAWPWLR